MMPVRPLLLLALLTACSSPSAHEGNARPGLSAADQHQIRALDSAYVAAWLEDDTAGVLATLAPDAIMMPAGHHPLTGASGVSEFWWPKDGSHTKILTFNRHIDELEGTGDAAWTRGTDSLTFTYSKGAIPPATMGNRSMTLALLRRQKTGQWRISRMMWATRND